MKEFLGIITNPKTRLWLYGIAFAAIPLIGIINADQIPQWQFLALMVLGLGAPGAAFKNWNGWLPKEKQEVIVPVEEIKPTTVIDAPESSEG